MRTSNSGTAIAPFSAGEGRTSVPVPPGACDCHVHVYDQRFPAVAGARLQPPDASVADYRQLQQRIGCERVVFVTPSTYGSDNRPMGEALTAFGDGARGVAVIDEATSDAQLEAMHVAGVRGFRMNLSLGTANAATDLVGLAARVAPLGWHLQLLAAPDTLVALEARLFDVTVPVVFDHLGRIPPSQADRHAAHRLVLRLIDAGRAWIKLSGGYIVSEDGPPGYDDVAPLAQGYLRAAPERAVWGSDWPHASATAGHQPLPDDAQQMDLLAQWTGSAAALRRVLVDNPAELYGFPKSTSKEPL